jgi:hypothetical protein
MGRNIKLNIMKKLFLISSFCDSEEKVQVLHNNILKIKELGHDTLLISPIDLPNDVTNKSDFYFRTKENPVSTIEEKTYIHWRQITNEYRLERFFPEYGWAALYQNKKLSQIGLTFDYDVYYHIIYDTKINEGLINQINSNVVNQYYSNKSTNGDVNEFSLHFIPLNREGLLNFEGFLNKHDYITSDDLTHDYMLKWVKKNNIIKNNFIIEEHINFYSDINFFSIYDGNNVNIFFEKHELDQQTNKIVCYDIKTNDVKIIVNNTFVFDKFEEKIPVETNLFTSEIHKLVVSIDGINYDCTDSYNKIGRNKIFYL